MPRLMPLLLLLVTLLLAGCGAETAGQGPDPAKAVPASAGVYMEAVVRPDGQLRADTEGALIKLLRTAEPDAKLHGWIDDALEREGHGLEWERDLEPWVGRRVGVWVPVPPRGGKPGAASGREDAAVLVIPAEDEQAAQAALDRIPERERAREASHAGVDYRVDKDGMAAAVVDGYVLAGDEVALKRTIDTLREGDSLADSDRYLDTLETLDDRRIAHAYFDLGALVDAALESNDELGFLRQAVPADAPPLGVALVADAGRIALESTAGSGGAAAAWLGAAEASELVAGLPGDAWAAWGVRDVGSSAGSLFQTLGFGVLGLGMAKQQFSEESGLDLDRDVLSWIGDVAAFVRGTTPDSVDGGVVIGVTDSDAATTAVARIAGVAATRGEAKVKPIAIDGAGTAFSIRFPEMPRPIVLARATDRVAITYGEDAARDALAGGERLGDTETYAAARDSVSGLSPSLLVGVPELLRMIDGSTRGDADYAHAKPYLETLRVFAAAAEKDGDRTRSRLAVGLR